MHNNDNIKLPLETLIVKLQNTGFRIGVDTHLQINKILQQYGVECMSNLQELKLLLSPIVAKNKAQQKLFSEIFDEYIDQVQQYQQKYYTQEEVTQSKEKQEQGAKKKWFVRISFLAVLVFVVVIFYSKQWFPFNQRVATNDTIADTTSTNITDETTIFQDTANTVTPRDSIIKEQDTTKQELIEPEKAENKETVFDNKPKLERKEPITDPDKITYDFKWWIKALLFAFFIVLWGLLELILWIIRHYRLYGFRKKELERKFEIHETPPFKLDFPEQQKHIRPQNDIFDFATSLRQRRQANKSSFDIEHTIKQTILRGGLPSLQFKAESKQSEYLILVDKQRADQPQGMLLNYFIETLKNEDVNIEKFVFYKDPRHCSNDEHPNGINLDELYKKFPEHDLIIFSKGEKLISTRQRVISDWTINNFGKWKNKAIVTPVPSTDWGYTEQKLAQLFVVIPTEISALLQLVETLTDAENYNFDKQRKIHVEQPQINPDVQLWLTTISILDKNDWNLILAIGKALYEKGIVKEQLLTFNKLNQLLGLSILQEEEIPQTEKEKLVNDLTQYPDVEKVARTAILQMYKATNPPENSYASSEKHIQTSIQNIKIEPNTKQNQHQKNVLNSTGLSKIDDFIGIKFSKLQKIFILSSIIFIFIFYLIELILFILDEGINDVWITPNGLAIVLFSIGIFYVISTIKNKPINRFLIIGNFFFIAFLYLVGLLLFNLGVKLAYPFINSPWFITPKKELYFFYTDYFTSIVILITGVNVLLLSISELITIKYYILIITRLISFFLFLSVLFFFTNFDYNSSEFHYSTFNQFQNMDEDYLKTLKVDSTIFYNNKGTEFYNKNKIDSAVLNYNKAILIDTNYFSPKYNLAIIDYNKGVEYFNKDSFELAKSYFEKIINDSLRSGRNNRTVFSNLENDSLKNRAQENIDLCEKITENEIFWINSKEGYFIDNRDGQTYKVAKIGNQIWMTENYNYFPYVSKEFEPNGIWIYGYNGENVSAANRHPNYLKFGILYDRENAIKFAPDGWHLPTTAECNQLIRENGGKKKAYSNLKNILNISLGGYRMGGGGYRKINERVEYHLISIGSYDQRSTLYFTDKEYFTQKEEAGISWSWDSMVIGAYVRYVKD